MAQVLLDTGIHLVALEAPGDVKLWVTEDAGETREARATLIRRKRPVGPAETRRLSRSMDTDAHVILIAPVINAPTQAILTDLGWSWIAASERPSSVVGFLRLPGWQPVRIGTDPRDSPAPSARATGRTPWGTFAVMRTLLSGGTWSQTELAHSAAVSQPRISQILAELARDGLVGRLHGQHPRWQVADWNAMLRRWLDTYPGPGGVSTYWYGLNSVVEQTAAAIAALDIGHAGDATRIDPVVSSDAAAEFIAPYRRPQQTVVYSSRGGDLSKAGLTPSGPGEATLVLVVPIDRSIWPAAEAQVEELATSAPFSLADPAQVVWDLLRAPGSDADQAAEAVIDAYAAQAHRR